MSEVRPRDISNYKLIGFYWITRVKFAPEDTCLEFVGETEVVHNLTYLS